VVFLVGLTSPKTYSVFAGILGIILFAGYCPAFADKDDIPPPPVDSGSGTSAKPNKPKAQYVYQVPQDLKDGWKVGDLRKEKADLDKIVNGVDQIREGAIPAAHGLLVLRHGKLLLEEYFNKQKAEGLHPLFSCTKSVFSAIYGIAQEQGLLNLDQKIYGFYTDYRSKAGWDPRKDDITVRMLLSMTSGLDCTDAPTKSEINCEGAMAQSKDWLAYCLTLPQIRQPGKVWIYNGACLALLSNLIAKKSGMSFSRFADKTLLEPLGIQGKTWIIGPNEVARVDTGLYWKHRDMAKLGQLYLNQGLWEGKRIVSEEWVKDSTTIHAPPGMAFSHDYGYLWHLKSMKWKGRVVPVFYANGYMGQEIFVSPDADLVCVMTAGSYDWHVYMKQENFFESTILGSFN
jgi:CubicO group peptidase (beta-lactamase class C family)